VQWQGLCLLQQSAATRPTEGAGHLVVGPTQQHRRPSQRTRQQQPGGSQQQQTAGFPPSQLVSSTPVCHNGTMQCLLLSVLTRVCVGCCCHVRSHAPDYLGIESCIGRCSAAGHVQWVKYSELALCADQLHMVSCKACLLSWSWLVTTLILHCRRQCWAAAGAASKWGAAAEQQW
jgi:hypothetical protein